MELKPYTVILLYPDYVTDDFGETFMTSVDAIDPVAAVREARLECLDSNKWTGEDAYPLEDFRVIAVMAGKHEDLNPER